MPIYNYEGWTPDYDEVERLVSKLEFRSFGQAAPDLKDDGIGEINLLYRNLLNIRGSWPYYVQTTSDCVSHSFARGVMLLMATEIIHGEKEIYAGDVSSEDVYGGSRIFIGKGSLGSSGGSVGAWGAEYIKQYGTLLRKIYGKYDLTQYSGKLADLWGIKGPPRELEEYSRNHTIQSYNLCDSAEEARAAIANGYPVIICSSRGFKDYRDKSGFGVPSGTWYHAMLLVGCDDFSKRKSFIVDNTSWGPNWISGNVPEFCHDIPGGMMPVDWDIVDQMLSEGDSYSISSFNGYKKRKVQFENLLL